MKKAERLQELLNRIPKGKVVTYKMVAKKLRIHPRYAGFLLSRNDSRKAPCYKVVRTDGSLGGYSAEGGLKAKIKLLEKDGIGVVKNKVSKDYFTLP